MPTQVYITNQGKTLTEVSTLDEAGVESTIDWTASHAADIDAGDIGVLAPGVSYTPGDGADWVDTDPANIQEAVDRLAAGAGTNPVPA